MNELFCKCNSCGYEKAYVIDCITRTSNPPSTEYYYKCPKCNYEGYTQSQKVYSIARVEDPCITMLHKYCKICGNMIHSGEICDECKEAVKWVKEQMKLQK